MHSPPRRTAKDLLLHVADEANTIVGTEGVKSRGEFARPGDTHLIPLAQVFIYLRFNTCRALPSLRTGYHLSPSVASREPVQRCWRALFSLSCHGRLRRPRAARDQCRRGTSLVFDRYSLDVLQYSPRDIVTVLRRHFMVYIGDCQMIALYELFKPRERARGSNALKIFILGVSSAYRCGSR